jgi:hypothetical protein
MAKSTTPPPFISIPLPEFDRGAEVWLHFQGATIPTSIKIRVYNPDRNLWLYRVALSGQWHQASEFTPRSGEVA